MPIWSSQGYTTRRPVEQAHAQPFLQAAQRLAETGCGKSGHTRRLAKAACARNHYEGGEIVQFCCHCATFRTARAKLHSLSITCNSYIC